MGHCHPLARGGPCGGNESNVGRHFGPIATILSDCTAGTHARQFPWICLASSEGLTACCRLSRIALIPDISAVVSIDRGRSSHPSRYSRHGFPLSTNTTCQLEKTENMAQRGLGPGTERRFPTMPDRCWRRAPKTATRAKCLGYRRAFGHDRCCQQNGVRGSQTLLSKLGASHRE